MSSPLLIYHYDLKHAMWNHDYMCATTSTLKSWGYRAILLEVEDKYCYSSSPSFAHPDSWSREEMKRAAMELRAEGMEVIPLVQTLGHSEYVLRHDEFADLRECEQFVDQYDPQSKASREFIIGLIDEIIEVLKPERYFHMGGDETRNLGKSQKGRELVDKIGSGGLYMKHMLPLFEHVHARGLQPIIWPDIVLAHPEVIEDIPQYVALMDWDYWTAGERWPELRIWGRKGVLDWQQYQQEKEDWPEFVQYLERYAVDKHTPMSGTFRSFYCMDALLEKGFEVFLAPAARSQGDSFGLPNLSVHVPNCFYAARKGMSRGLGCCVTSWAVRHNHPVLSLPSAFAASFGLSTDEPLLLDEFSDSYTRERYGKVLAGFSQLMEIARLPVQWSSTRSLKTFNLEDDRTALKGWLEYLDQSGGGREAEADSINEVKAAYEKGLVLAKLFAGEAKFNSGDFAFWCEGLEYQIFCADFSLACLFGGLGNQRQELLRRLHELRKRTAELFATTFTPHSVVEETERRYAMHARLLNAMLPE